MDRIYDKGLAVTYATVAVLFVILVVVMYSLLTEFKPMTLDNVTVVPSQACPGELIAVDGDFSVAKGNYDIIVDPAWTNVEDGRYWDIAEASFPVEGPVSTKDGSSDIVYMVPTEPGQWQFSVNLRVTGRKGILPREQVQMYKSTDVTEVVDCGDAYTYEEYMMEMENG